ncbi:unnamed protein product [Rotaria sordida]|uniref:Ion transport domain-containing protein n=1 Tax=Rotaria sordida TaxID=392033 RepID=A0A815EIT6_9BILA|nr:unnamed protein product [Rotaria sordida]
MLCRILYKIENVPWCYYPRDFPTYQIKTNESTDFGQRLTIVKQQSIYKPNEILNLTVDLLYETAQRFRLRIYDSTKKRFEVPLQVPVIKTKVNVTDYEVSISQVPFAILVKRKSTGVTLFDSSVSPLIYANQFIKFSSRLSSPFLYGLGEHRQPLLINITNEWRKLTFWTRDFPPVQHVNLYGVHPFHINVEMKNNSPTNFHGHFFLNSNAMDIDLQPLPAITYTTIGGIIALFLFTGPSAQDIIQQYWDVIGKPTMPPYWSLGKETNNNDNHKSNHTIDSSQSNNHGKYSQSSLKDLASSTTLALEDINTRQQPTFSYVLAIFDKMFTVIFTIELILKWFAYGITNYLKNGWNKLDFIIVVVSVLGTVLDLFDVADIPAFKSMRTLRALRPLKALSRFEGIRV